MSVSSPPTRRVKRRRIDSSRANPKLARTFLLPVWNLITAIFSLLTGTTKQKRKLSHFAMGLPALAFICATIYLVTYAQAQHDQLQTRYWVEANQALANNRLAHGEMLLKRVLLSPSESTEPATFALMKIYHDTNRPERAAELLNKLAPINKVGYKPAHKYRALQISKQMDSEARFTSGQLQEFSWHLQNAGLAHDSPDLSNAWGKYCLQTGNAIGAIQHLKNCCQKYPLVYRLLGDQYHQLATLETDASRRKEYSQNADAAWQNAKTTLAGKLSNAPNDRQLRLEFGLSLARLREHQKALQVFQEGVDVHGDSAFNIQISRLWVALFERTSNTDAVSKLASLASALKAWPENFEAIQHLLSLATSADDEFRAQMIQEIGALHDSPYSHLVLGCIEFQRENKESAIFHLERAANQGSEIPVILNNLADLVVKEDPNRALNLISTAIQTSPTDPRFLATRGQILKQLGRLDEAIDDLELSLRRIPVNFRPQIHQELSEIYQQRNQPELSEFHKAKAKSGD